MSARGYKLSKIVEIADALLYLVIKLHIVSMKIWLSPIQF
jgi:hypothetical protein